jgi:hypothetical protein
MGVAVGNLGCIYVTDNQNQRVVKYCDAAVPARNTTWGRVKSLYR